MLALSFALASVSPAPAARRGVCPATLAGQLAATGSARQLVTVVDAAPAGTSGVFTRFERGGGCWRQVGPAWQVELGWNGVSTHHREGDGTTPEGAYGIGATMYGLARDPGVRYRYLRLGCGDWWDEDPASPAYNQLVRLGCGVRPPFGGDSEALWLSPVAYAHFALIDYNTDPVVPGAGSAIFLHIASAGPTDGCVALAAPELLTALRWFRPALVPLIVIGTAADIRRF